MPRLFTYIVLLGLVAAIAVAIAFLRGSPPSASSTSLMEGGTPAKPFGNTAISHGGPSPTRSEVEAPAGADQMGIGQHVVIKANTPLLSSIPTGDTGSPSPSDGPSVPAGTAATVVAIAPAVPPDTRQVETYYKVQLPDGRAGWIPEHALQTATPPATGVAPR